VVAGDEVAPGTYPKYIPHTLSDRLGASRIITVWVEGKVAFSVFVIDRSGPRARVEHVE
jgi:hypothetical protein